MNNALQEAPSREQIAANLQAWVLDLESPDARQERCSMISDDGSRYCCLGRAAVVLGISAVEIEAERPYATVRQGMGLTRVDESRCMDMNDGRGDFFQNPQTFPQIAAWLRENVLPGYTSQSAVENSSSG